MQEAYITSGLPLADSSWQTYARNLQTSPELALKIFASFSGLLTHSHFDTPEQHVLGDQLLAVYVETTLRFFKEERQYEFWNAETWKAFFDSTGDILMGSNYSQRIVSYPQVQRVIRTPSDALKNRHIPDELTYAGSLSSPNIFGRIKASFLAMKVLSPERYEEAISLSPILGATLDYLDGVATDEEIAMVADRYGDRLHLPVLPQVEQVRVEDRSAKVARRAQLGLQTMISEYTQGETRVPAVIQQVEPSQVIHG